MVHQVRILERRLEESSWTPSEQSNKTDDIQHSLFEKEKTIRNLESEVENQVIDLTYHKQFWRKSLKICKNFQIF